jgi:hypothetical protein
VAIGAAVAPHLRGDRLIAALVAFFLAVGIAAHALDELTGRPLRTHLTDRTLIVLAAVGLGGATGIGIAGAIVVSPLLIPLVAAGAFVALAYNLELFGGRFHSDAWFALSWGGFPAFTAYFATTLTITATGLLVPAACCLTSLAQRRLSTPARDLRRRTAEVSGVQRFTDGHVEALDADRLSEPLEGALKALGLAHVLLALGLIAARV